MADSDVELVVRATLNMIEHDRQAAAERARRVAPIRRMYETRTGREVSAELLAALRQAGLTDAQLLGSGLSYGSICRMVQPSGVLGDV